MQRLFIYLIALFLLACIKKEIDGVQVKTFSTKQEYFKEGRFHAYGQTNRKKSYPLAKYYLKEALKKDATDIAVIELLGSIYRKTGRADIEEKLYLRSLKISPNNNRLKLTLGRLFYIRKDYHKAEQILQSCVHNNSSANAFLPCYDLLASTYAKNYKIKKALNVYEQELKFYYKNNKNIGRKKGKTIHPALGAIYVKMAELYLYKKDYDRALQNTSKAQFLLPRGWPAYKKASELVSQIEKEVNTHIGKKRNKRLLMKRISKFKKKSYKRKSQRYRRK